MSYRIAGIDVHKKMLAVVVSDVEVEGEYKFERRMFGSNPEQLRSLAAWLLEQEVEEVVMESTAQYWKPVWEALERHWKPLRQKQEGASRRSGTLHLAQAQSNRGRRGRKRDFPDAERLVKRLVARELILSFVPDPEQRLWRTVTRRKYQLTRDRVRLQNQLESLLEEIHIKLSCLVSDLLGVSAQRMLKALATTSRYPEKPEGLLSLDPQMICYSWISGIRDVALVVFIRKNIPEIQYLKTIITEEQQREYGRLVDATVSQIESGQFSPRSGIGFPQNGCVSCSHLGLCLDRQELITTNLIRKPGASTLDWLDELVD